MDLNLYYLNRYVVDVTSPSTPERFLASPVDQSVLDSVVFINPVTNTVEDSLTHALKNPMLADSLLATMVDTSQSTEYGTDDDKLATLKPRNCQSAAETKVYLDALREYAENAISSDDSQGKTETKSDISSDTSASSSQPNNAGGEGN